MIGSESGPGSPHPRGRYSWDPVDDDDVERSFHSKETPDEGPEVSDVDAYIGGRVRRLRQLLDMTQAALADRIGVSYQQLQKYERGSNRISASRLYRVALALGEDVSWFFDGLPMAADDEG